MGLPIDVQKVIDHLLKDINLKCILIYGSFAKGTFNTKSDVDIAIAEDKKIPNERFFDILAEISKLTNRKIDLVDLNKIHPPLSQEVFNTNIWIRKDPLIYARTLSRTLIETEDFLKLKMKIQKTRVERFIK